MELEFKEKLYYTRSSKGKIGFCREGNYTPEEYVKNCQKQGYDVIKASYKIIDILEVGDYVNGYKVSAIYNPNGDEIVNITLIMEYGYETINTYIDDYSINSIVTKEQFEQMAYKVGD